MTTGKKMVYSKDMINTLIVNGVMYMLMKLKQLQQ